MLWTTCIICYMGCKDGCKHCSEVDQMLNESGGTASFATRESHRLALGPVRRLVSTGSHHQAHNVMWRHFSPTRPDLEPDAADLCVGVEPGMATGSVSELLPINHCPHGPQYALYELYLCVLPVHIMVATVVQPPSSPSLILA